MHPGRQIGGSSDDLGPLVRLPCSECEVIQWFHLKHHVTYVRLLWLQISKTSLYSLQCAECDYEIDLSDDDAQKAVSFLPVADAFAAGKMNQAEFLAKLAEVGFHFLKEVAKTTINWKCSKCGEDSPLTFSECWKCGAVHEGSQNDAEDDSPKTPYLDQAMKDEVGPFGPVQQ
jgi:hypothetical protein